MTHPIPPGTRDLLPDEMRELRRLEAALIDVFSAAGYGEVRTPTIEYHDVLARGDAGAGAPAAYRFFDETGDVLALRSDMTVPIARLVANRYADAEGPLRFFYAGNAFRAVRPQRGQMREFRQAGIELIGSAAPAGTVEVVGVLSAALDAAELGRAVIGLGDADLYRRAAEELGVGAERRAVLLARLASHDLVGLSDEIDATTEIGEPEREVLRRLPSLRGGREVIDEAIAIGGDALALATRGLAKNYDGLVARGVAGRISLDLGLLRDIGYYTGAILEVYDPAIGHILGGGGRYDGLLARFGSARPAAGFALYLERVHIAQAEEERIAAEEGGKG